MLIIWMMKIIIIYNEIEIVLQGTKNERNFWKYKKEHLMIFNCNNYNISIIDIIPGSDIDTDDKIKEYIRNAGIQQVTCNKYM